MYVPPSFAVADRAWTLELIACYPFGLLITGDADYPRVSYLPMVAEERDGELWVLGHVARANAHTQSILEKSAATIAFQGPHAYVSAAWYEKPYETVPTWNYTAVNIDGRLSEADPWRVLQLLTAKFEAGRTDPWDPERLDRAYRESQIQGIIAFELRAERLYAKAKLSQNRTQEDRRRVMEQLSLSDNPLDRDCAEAMRRH